jgi:hypothetical protein
MKILAAIFNAGQLGKEEHMAYGPEPNGVTGSSNSVAELSGVCTDADTIGMSIR